jgi:predicted transcriptional regulator
MSATTTIRLPPDLRARLAVLAEQTGRSVHSLIVEAVERHADYVEQVRLLVLDARAADADIDRAGEIYRRADVQSWVDRLAAEDCPPRPAPWRP